MKFPIAKNDEIPGLDFYVKAFAEFENQIKDRESYEEIKEAFVNAFNIYPPIGLSPDTEAEFFIYRTRVIDELQEDIANPATFSYNRNIEKVEQGRANIKGVPVFYGSISEDAAIRESKDKIQEGQVLYISQWRLKKNVKYGFVNLVFDGSKTELGEMIHSFNKHRTERLKRMFDIYDKEKQDALLFFLMEISSTFLRDNYKVSSFLSHYYLNENIIDSSYKIDMIMYPSIQSKRNTFNFAIRPDFVDESMELVEVKRIRVNKFEKDGGSHVSFLNTGKPQDGKVQWCKKGVLLPENIKIDSVGVIIKEEKENTKDWPLQLNKDMHFNFTGYDMTYEELFEGMIPNNFDILATACFKKVDNNDPYKTHKIIVNWNQKEGLMKVIYRNQTYNVLRVVLHTTFNLVDVEIDANKLFTE